MTTPISILTRLTLQYDAKAPAQVPASLILKAPLPGDPRARPFAMREIRFYRRFAKHVTNLPLPHCHAADPGTGEGSPWLLLEDLSASHQSREWPLPLPGAALEGAVDALAALHAVAWQDSPAYARACQCPEPIQFSRRVARG